jgi:hypothetical protein
MTWEDMVLIAQRDRGVSRRVAERDIRLLLRDGEVRDLGNGMFDITEWIKQEALASLWR